MVKKTQTKYCIKYEYKKGRHPIHIGTEFATGQKQLQEKKKSLIDNGATIIQIKTINQ